MWFFNRKEDALTLPDKFTNSIVHPVSNMLFTVKIGSNIVIKEGWNVAVVVRERPRDILAPGAVELNLPNLPNTTRLLKLNEGKIKKSKKDFSMQLPQSFKCDLYYVNKNPIEQFPWKSGRVSVKSKLYGRYKVNLFGFLTFQIVNTEKFLRLMLMERSHIKENVGGKILSNLINEEICDSILFSKFYNPKQFADKQTMNAYLLNKLNENFDPWGLKFLQVDMQGIKFYGKVNELVMKEDEARQEFLAEKLDVDDMLKSEDFENERNVFREESQINKTTVENMQDLENTQRVVSTKVMVKKKNTKQDFQDQISQTLMNNSRFEINDGVVDKIKLKNTNKE